jgi:putative aminopeptidase FrvX
VVAVYNGHFARQHRGDTAVTTVDDLWIDVGASSPDEVARLGIALLDPVAPDRPLWTFAGLATGPAAGARAGCAAVASAAAQVPARGETLFVLSSQRVFGWVGLATLLASLGAVDRVAVVDAGRAVRSAGAAPAARLPQPVRALGGRVSGDSLWMYAPAVRWAGSMVEAIADDESQALLRWVAEQAGVSLPTTWVALPADTARKLAPRHDDYREIEGRFMQLADLPGVPGHEWRVRDAIRDALPDWARRIASVDSAGNLVVAAGPERDTVAFIAHMDEVAFEVDRILPDGRVTLRRMGGVVVQSWEGVPALLHFDRDGSAPARESLRGVFVPRDSARTRIPSDLTAWFGMDSARLVAHGVRPGLGITAYKRAERLAGTRITGRASDDRTGSTALLTAIRGIDPGALPRKVFFVWSVREEGGLNGARAFGNTYRNTLQRVYSIDTFVSSDTPLESPHFAFAPLGAGAVLRGLDDGSLVPRAERNRILALARREGIPVQLGTTQGSTDGSAIAPWGPPNIGLSWPGRYSHGPAEVLDLRDVSALARLIRAVALH